MVVTGCAREADFFMKRVLILIPLFAVSLVEAADTDALAARRLYYQDNAPEVVFKATTVAPKATPPKSAVTATNTTPPAQTANAVSTRTTPGSKSQQIEKIQEALRAAATTALSSGGGSQLKPAANLGVRYNVLRVDARTNTRTEVSPDTIFHEKDCIAVRIQPNRGGFLYVFNQASSGSWQALIPSPQTADDSNVVHAYNLMDVPENYCFEMDEKPGTERLLIVVTDKPEDVMKLNDSLKNGTTPGNGKPEGYVVAEADMKPFTSGLQGRDLKVTRVGAKAEAGEAPYSTYLVNAAATTSDRLVLEIKLKHVK
jgi:hypothetical protein